MSAKRPKLDQEEITELMKSKETEGFDLEAGQVWIYPTNYSLRDYQYNIIKEALFKNTMVSLPTGLGKTFIAAVVMYNFYRWYPTGKIVFMAPTRPLVKQQVDACYNVMAIPKEITVELTGSKIQASRKGIWQDKRVFFITPQVLQNDLSILKELGPKIKCLVIDEAHKAKGNHAYCEVIRKLIVQNKFFRVLALSATPGNTVNDVTEVIENLLIAHLEFRTDDSPDVVPYIFERSLETVVVPLDDILIKIQDEYIKLLERYTRVLMQNKVLMGNCSNLTKGKIFMTMKNYQETNRQNRDKNYNEIMKYLNICHTLYYAYELLLRHGLRSFLLFFQERIENSMLSDNVILRNIIREVEVHLGPLLNIQTLPDGSITGVPESAKFGHPKFYRLRDITCDHFKQENNLETRVIIFCEYRETVMEAYGILSLHQPLIKPRIFMGKTSITQKQQLSVIKAFRDGSCNTLISTCIGEEGIDVGNVDLIVCFDISNKSPIRMIQRMGRTGRKREGRVVILVTEGREQQTLKECLIQKQSLSYHILQSKSFENDMYKENPRMIPIDLEPKCNKIFITVKGESNQKPSKNKNQNLKDLFKTIAKENKNILQNDTPEDIISAKDKLPFKESYWDKGKNFWKCNKTQPETNFANNINKLRVLQPTGFVGHSSNTEMLVSLLQSCESKKFNIPMTQTLLLISQPTQAGKSNSGPSSMKQTDIRNMFCKPSFSTGDSIPALQCTATRERHDTKNALNEKITNYLSALDNDYNNNCEICTNLFDCTQYHSRRSLDFDINTWIEPDPSILDSLTKENLLLFEKSLEPLVENTNVESKTETIEEVPDDTTEKKEELDVTVTNDVFGDTSGFMESPFKAPANIQRVLQKCNIFNSPLPSIPFTQLEQQHFDGKKDVTNTLSLNIKGFEDIEFTQLKNHEIKEDINKSDLSNSLSCFHITELEDIFEDSNDDTIKYSPSNSRPDSCSPILSFSRNRTVRSDKVSDTPQSKINSQISNKRKTISPERDDLVDTSITSPILSNQNKRVKTDSSKAQFDSFDITDIADLSTFGLNDAIIDVFKNSQISPQSAECKLNSENDSKNSLEMFCDESFFVDTNKIDDTEPLPEKSHKNNNEQTKVTLDSNKKEWETDIWNFCVDSDSSLDEKLQIKNVQPIPNKVSEVENTETPSDVIDLTFDDSLSSPERSPSLIKSQRFNTQKSPLINRRINNSIDETLFPSTSNNSKNVLKSVLTLKKVENRKSIESENSSPTTTKINFDKSPSPVLSKREDTFYSVKSVKKLEFSDDDEDDFELNSKTVSWIRPKRITANQLVQKSSVNVMKKREKSVALKNNFKHDQEKCLYLDLEAEVSGSETVSEDDSCLDGSFEKSFVDDNTESFMNTTIMHGQYLESVKDANRGQFKIPQLPPSNLNVYSQEENIAENTYLNDTFCVNSQQIEHDVEDLSELEVAELILEEKKNKKKRKIINGKTAKRKRIIINDSSDSD